MGWKVFYQVIFILTPTRLTELTSKREGNYYVMILRPADHGLHVNQSRLNLIFLPTAMNSSLYRLIVATISSPSYPLGSTSALAFSGIEVPRVACEPKQFVLIIGSQRLLADQRFFRHGQAWLLGRRHQLLPGRLGGRVTLQYLVLTMQG